jgi:hypothetical protein
MSLSALPLYRTHKYSEGNTQNFFFLILKLMVSRVTARVKKIKVNYVVTEYQ